MIIECTKKLADVMKVKLNPYEEGNDKEFFQWHANLCLTEKKVLC